MRDLRNLPTQVLERLAGEFGDEALADPIAGFDVLVRNGRTEGRHFSTVEIRQTDDGDPIVDGYATVYDSWYDVFGGPPLGWREMFAQGATRKSVVERDDVRLLVNHEGVPLARTRSGTLELESDDVGLRAATPTGVDMRSPAVQEMVSALERGDLDEMSLAFRTTKQEWNGDYTERIIREVQLFDVSVVTYPANPYTVAQLRSGTFPVDDASVTSRTVSVELARAIADSVRIPA